jgi:hypothetical protein
LESKIDLEATLGEIEQVTLEENGRSMGIHVVDSTGILTNTQLTIRGLEKGSYRVTAGKFRRTLESSGQLQLALPISQARRIQIRRL